MQHCCIKRKSFICLCNIVAFRIYIKQLIYKMKKSLLLLLLGLSMTACKKDVDNTAPVFEILNAVPAFQAAEVCGELASKVITVYTKDTIVWDVSMTDNEALSQYKIDIHENFDCHGHRSPLNAWSLQKIVNLEGASVQEAINIVVPEDARAGTYHLQIRLLDDSGNEGTPAIYSLKVKNQQDTIAPTLTLTNTLLTHSIQKGGQFNIKGSLSDDLILNGGQLELVYFTTTGNRQVATKLDIQTNTKDHNFSIDYTIPTTFVDGKYDFYLYGYDSVGNASAKIAFEVSVN